MERCDRPCLFRCPEDMENYHGYRCRYLEIMGRSKVAKVYKRLGIDHMTDEAREALEPENCLCFIKAPAGMKIKSGFGPDGVHRMRRDIPAPKEGEEE